MDTLDGSALAASRGEIVRRREEIAREDLVLRRLLARVIDVQRAGNGPVNVDNLSVTVDS